MMSAGTLGLIDQCPVTTTVTLETICVLIGVLSIHVKRPLCSCSLERPFGTEIRRPSGKMCSSVWRANALSVPA